MRDALDQIREAGFPVTGMLGAGMEGAVAALDDTRVVKLWDRRDRAEVERLRMFYDAVAETGFALTVPRILDVVEADGRVLTVQVRLHGEPLSSEDADAVVEVLAALTEVAVQPDLAVLPVPDGEPPFDPAAPFNESMAALVERRARLLGDHLASGVAAALVDELRELTRAEPRLIHGDLAPGNILMIDGRPSALLDFGYVTTVGDPAFDAAIATVLLDMFGPDAAASRNRLEHLVVARFGYGAHRLALYRAAYGVVTASCLVADSDGRHFRWCLDLLDDA
ncbi:MAG: phosphotransferase [Nocardioides sp.]